MKTVVLAVLFVVGCSRCSDYHILECPTGRHDFAVDHLDAVLTCRQSPVSNDTIFWSILNYSQNATNTIGTCSSVSPGSVEVCDVNNNYRYIVKMTRTGDGVSTLRLQGLHKSILVGTLRCGGFNQPKPELSAATCRLNVTAKGKKITTRAATSTTSTATTTPTNATTTTTTPMTAPKATSAADNGSTEQPAKSRSTDDEDEEEEDGSSVYLSSSEKAGVAIVIVAVVTISIIIVTLKVNGYPRRKEKTAAEVSADVENTPVQVH